MDTFSLLDGTRITTAQLSSEIASSIPDRISKHQQRIRERGRELGGSDGGLILLAHGDSWFDYPLDSFGGTSYTDVVYQLNERMGAPHAMQILSFAHWGAPLIGSSIADASVVGPNGELVDDPVNEDDPNAVSSRFMLGQVKRALQDSRNGKFDGLMISAGGNDFAGDQYQTFLNDANAEDIKRDPQKALNNKFFEQLNSIRLGYEGLVRFRDRYLQDKPMFVDGYANAIPDGVSVCKGGKAWLKPSLDAQGWTDPGVAAEVVRITLEHFRSTIRGLPGEKIFLIDSSSVIDTGDWINELHPRPEGFYKVAGQFLNSMRSYSPFTKRV